VAEGASHLQRVSVSHVSEIGLKVFKLFLRTSMETLQDYLGCFYREPLVVPSSNSTGLKGTVSRDNLYWIFFIHHILLVLLQVLLEDFKFRRSFAVLFNQKGTSPV
jgi:hypothetical protein